MNKLKSFLSPARSGRGILVAPGFCPVSRFLAKTQKPLVKSFWNFTMTFLATWGCASDFLEMLPKFKMAARGQLQIFLWAQKLRNYSNFTITFPTIWRCASGFLRFCWNSKWPPWLNFIFSCGRKNWKIEISNNSHCTITLPTIWNCACDFTEI